MPAERLSMRKIKEVLRLKFEAGVCQPADCAQLLDQPQYGRRLFVTGPRRRSWVSGPCRTDLDEADLEKRLFPTVAPRPDQPRAAAELARHP